MSQKTRDNSIGEEGRKKKKEEKMEREKERETVWEKVGEERVGLEGAK